MKYDRYKSCGESAKIIATSKLYHMLLFYNERSSMNTIIKTISYNNKTNQLEELNVMNISDFKGILNYEVDYIDIDNKDLILPTMQGEFSEKKTEYIAAITSGQKLKY